MPLSVWSQSCSSSSVAFCKAGYHSKGNACCLPFSFSTNSKPSANVTLTFFPCLRDVNSAIVKILLCHCEERSNRELCKTAFLRAIASFLAMTVGLLPGQLLRHIMINRLHVIIFLKPVYQFHNINNLLFGNLVE